MDQLEKFIRDNRLDLDRYEPGDAVWTKIRKVDRKNARVIPLYLLRAAMVIIIAVTSVLIYSVTSGNIYNRDKSLASDYRISPELAEAEIYYSTMTSNLLEEARPFMDANPALESELMTEIARLDSLSAGIRRDLKDNISNQEVIEALVVNYRIKVKLLEDMLDILNRQDQDNKDNKVKYEL
jgi:hypothetical protein